ncbi:MAG: hypothetical protein LBM77_05895 [Spirochaetaceae bacterium]|jgi:hypothetical protein|nr:hypothetical protein [Spirochaetaceae bacterium]
MVMTMDLDSSLVDTVKRVSGIGIVNQAVTKALTEYIRVAAANKLVLELDKGWESGTKNGWLSEDEAFAGLE